MGYYYRSFTKTANEKRQVESSKEEEHSIKIRRIDGKTKIRKK